MSTDKNICLVPQAKTIYFNQKFDNKCMNLDHENLQKLCNTCKVCFIEERLKFHTKFDSKFESVNLKHSIG